MVVCRSRSAEAAIRETELVRRLTVASLNLLGEVAQTEPQETAAPVIVEPELLEGKLAELAADIAGAFGRVEPRRTALAYLRGLLSEVPRKNCWHLARHAGDLSPDKMQRLLSRANWDEDAVRDASRSFVVKHLRSSDAVLVLDETGQEKKGTHTAGVGRQYTGTAGKVTNCIVAVYATYRPASLKRMDGSRFRAVTMVRGSTAGRRLSVEGSARPRVLAS